MNDLLIKDAVIADVVSGEISMEADIRVVGGRITELQSGLVGRAGERVLQASGLTVMPGLIDAHVHAVDYTPNRYSGFGYSPYYVGARALRELHGMLSRGFTTVRDTGGADAGLARAVAEGHAPGPRMLVSGRPITQTGGHGDGRLGINGPHKPVDHYMMGRIADGVPEVLKAVRDELRMGANQIKVMAGGGIDSPSDSVTSWQYSEEELRAAVETAASCGTYVLAHAYGPEAITRSVRAGVRSIEHGNLADAPTIDLMARAGTFLVPTLSVYESMVEGVAPSFDQPAVDVTFSEIYEQGLHVLEQAASAGVPIVFGTDLCGGSQHRQLREFLLRAEVLPIADVIRSATVTAAELIGRSGDLGVIEIGATADLLLLAGDPFASPALLSELDRHLECVVRSGVVINGIGSTQLRRSVA